MPVSFTRLRIAGFKSFAEPTTVELLPGLTGIVGPNGCGKSNVVEAMRWAMGENSARSLRGGEMDDVIFAGTTSRASRNIAEVTLTLGESGSDANSGAAPAVPFPPPFDAAPELQISRRIERGAGSTYRVNGREHRARDIQTLFADLASGARSSAMVSQGRVSSIVNARPDERRSILEEAAGITGLHARRHEAELKLRATEANLARAEDVRGQLDTQLQGLKRQARQAARYRNLSGTIQAAEMELLGIQQVRVTAGLAVAQAAIEVAAATATATAASAASAAAEAAQRSEALPVLREAEAVARTDLERRRLECEQIVAAEARARRALEEAAVRLGQLKRDLQHADRTGADAAASLARLGADAAKLHAEAAAHPARATSVEAELTAAGEAVRRAEAESHRATSHAAELTAKRQSLTQAKAQADAALARLAQNLARVTAERDRIIPIPAERITEAEATRAIAEAAVQSARQAAEAAEKRLAESRPAHATAREAATTADATRARLAAEVQALSEILAVRDGEKWPPMVDMLTVPDGLEGALGSALGEELDSAADTSAARHWRTLAPLPATALPPGTTRLLDLVAAPAALSRALGKVFLVDDTASGDAAQVELSAGQMLVSREGAVWRWDGYTIRAGTPTAATVRLQQRNRLNSLRTRLTDAAQVAETARAARSAAEAVERAAEAAERTARTARREAEQALERAREAASRLQAQATQQNTQRAGLDSQVARLETEHAAAAAEAARVQEATAALPDLEQARRDVEQARVALNDARTAESAVRSERDTLTRLHTARTQRQQAIRREQAEATKRAEDAASRLAELQARAVTAEAEHAALVGTPGEAQAARDAAKAAQEAATASHRAAASALAEAERAAAEATRAERATEGEATRAREAALRTEAALEQAQAAVTAMEARVIERLGAEAVVPPPTGAVDAEAEEKSRRRLEKLNRERAEMGPVNLRAELEAEEIEKQMALIASETAELTTAIAKLRGSIGHLNREGRERLTAIFQQVDGHFQALFTRMFGGGRAQLAMVGSDDPLAAGLEIYAQPPGKKLATLSLLSGGEQALTAMSLIFAVFKCNPAPVCVLDEVDAPLDDANVDRFCTLLEDMVRDTGTRFLVVTHHHLTMARMDRLYGVTMQERGISRLLSVDLAKAAEMVDQPRMAAE
jgi:chromosome segregation protein